MSRNLSILVDYPLEIGALVTCLQQAIGHPLVKSEIVEWNLYQTTVLAVQISVFDAQDFEDDQGIEFSRFSYIVGLEGIGWPECDVYGTEWPRHVALVLGSAMSNYLRCECVVVENLQRIVKVFQAAAASVPFTDDHEPPVE